MLTRLGKTSVTIALPISPAPGFPLLPGGIGLVVLILLDLLVVHGQAALLIGVERGRRRRGLVPLSLNRHDTLLTPPERIDQGLQTLAIEAALSLEAAALLLGSGLLLFKPAILQPVDGQETACKHNHEQQQRHGLRQRGSDRRRTAAAHTILIAAPHVASAKPPNGGASAGQAELKTGVTGSGAPVATPAAGGDNITGTAMLEQSITV